MRETQFKNYLAATYFFDFENQHIQNLIQEFQAEHLSKKEKTIQLYLKIRDGWWIAVRIV